MERRFHCTACGKCCSGSLPLTLADAWTHAGRFPLAMVWTPLRRENKAFHLASRIGATVKLGGRKEIAVLIATTAYMPDSFSCPELGSDGRCAIHAAKPLRCRTMPFYPYREEADQADLLSPRRGWECDTSAAAPVVYRDNKIVARGDFERERGALLQEAPLMRAYAEYMLKYMPLLADTLAAGANKGAGGTAVTSLSSFLTATRQRDVSALASRQLAVLNEFAARTAGRAELAEYHKHYAGWAKEMDYLSKREQKPA
ncbi:MAG: YkgJ family cysteine cluster protein [Proteobacteria bacterium]|nr:YkgJ family cysteine cluster protein [Pseudomonadota bacterium]